MTGRLARTARLTRTLSSLVAAILIAGCTNYFEIPIETPIKPKLDVTPFQRVLIAGFISGGTEDVDGNVETTRLLRSQLRTKSNLKVIDSDVVSLVDIVDKMKGNVATPAADPTTPKDPKDPKADVKSEKDLQAYEPIFADVAYWKKLGEEYQNPLIVTGVVYFTDINKSGIVETPRETINQLGQRSVVSVRQRTTMLVGVADCR